MKIGVPIYEYRRLYPLERIPEKMKAHGIDSVDYADLYNTESKLFRLDEESFKEVLTYERCVLESGGITVHQIHGPWRYPPKDGTAEERRQMLEAMKKGVRAATYLGAPYMVVHPLMPYGEEGLEHTKEIFDINAQHFGALAEYAKDFPVTVCIENMPYPRFPISTVKQVLDLVKYLQKSNIKVCLDTGHANVLGTSPGDGVRILGQYLATLHVHDNSGTTDAHLHIGEGVINWNDFSRALHKINFSGVVSAEPNMRGNFTVQEIEKRQALLARNLKKIADNTWE